MRRNIIQSKTEPNKNDIWLSEEGLKKYGKNGWEPLGGGSNNSGGSNSGGYTDMMVLNTMYNATLTEEQFNEIKERINANSRFKIEYKESDGTLTYICYGIPYSLTTEEELYAFVPQNSYYSAKDFSFTDDICFFASCVNNEYFFGHIDTKNANFELPILKTPKFYYTGNGTKFLSDDGTYKEVSGGNEPVIIEITEASNLLTDEQIEAAKNGNVKIKLNAGVQTFYMLPYNYTITDDTVGFCVRGVDGDFFDWVFEIDIINKTISKK